MVATGRSRTLDRLAAESAEAFGVLLDARDDELRPGVLRLHEVAIAFDHGRSDAPRMASSSPLARWASTSHAASSPSSLDRDPAGELEREDGARLVVRGALHGAAHAREAREGPPGEPEGEEQRAEPEEEPLDVPAPSPDGSKA